MSATDTNRIASEASTKTIRALLQAIDAHQGSLTTREAQDALLTNLIASGQADFLGRVNGARTLINHTIASLRKKITQYSKQQVDKTLPSAAIWTHGSSLYSETWLTSIGMARRSETNAIAAQSASTGHAAPESTTVQDNMGVKGADDTEKQASQAEMRAEDDHTRSQTAETPSSSAPQGSIMTVKHVTKRVQDNAAAVSLKRPAPSGHSQVESDSAAKRRKVEARPSASNKAAPDTAVDEPVLVTQRKGPEPMATIANEKSHAATVASPAPAGVATADGALQGGERTAAALALFRDQVRNGDIDLVAFVAEEIENGHLDLAQLIRDSSRSVHQRDFSGRILGPRKNARREHALELSKAQEATSRASDMLYPPELPEMSTENDREENLRQAVLAGVSDSLRSLSRMAQDFSGVFCAPLRLKHNADAVLVPQAQATPRLTALYEKVLGSNPGYALLNRRNQEHPWTLDASHVLHSMIAAEVMQKVFCVEQPWTLEARLQDVIGDSMKYGEKAMLDKGYMLDDFLKQWSFKIVSQRSSEGRPPGAPANDIDWVNFLENLFHEALLMKCKIETYGDTTFEYYWPEPGSLMVREQCSPLSWDRKPDQRIMLTMWPGVKATTKHLLSPAASEKYFEAIVLTTIHL